MKTVINLLNEARILGVDGMGFVFDRRFRNYENINELFTKHRKFVILVNTKLAIVHKLIESTRGSIRNFTNYSDDDSVYAVAETAAWDYERKRPSTRRTSLKDGQRIYVHLFFNLERAVEDESVFNRRMAELRKEIAQGGRVQGCEKLCERVFAVTGKSGRSVKVSYNATAVVEAKARFGYFTLLSNENRDPIAVLEVYRIKDVIEKALSDIKGKQNRRRTLVSLERSLDGKLFVEFIALIILLYVKKHMQDARLFGKICFKDCWTSSNHSKSPGGSDLQRGTRASGEYLRGDGRDPAKDRLVMRLGNLGYMFRSIEA